MSLEDNTRNSTEPDKLWDDPARLRIATKVTLSVFLLLLAYWGIVWAINRPMFTITALVVEAPDHAEPRHITRFEMRSTVTPQLKGNFFTMDLEKTREAFETMPWVHAASIRRRWPNGIVVTLEEHVALGTWGDKGELLSRHGVSFMANIAEAEEYGRLAAFSGPAGTEALVVERYNELRQWLAPAKLTPVELTLSERHSWTVKLDGGILLNLGRDETEKTVHDRVKRFLSVYPQLRSRLGDRMQTVDLRYSHGMAIKAPGAHLKPLPKPT